MYKTKRIARSGSYIALENEFSAAGDAEGEDDDDDDDDDFGDFAEPQAAQEDDEDDDFGDFAGSVVPEPFSSENAGGAGFEDMF